MAEGAGGGDEEEDGESEKGTVDEGVSHGVCDFMDSGVGESLGGGDGEG